MTMKQFSVNFNDATIEEIVKGREKPVKTRVYALNPDHKITMDDMIFHLKSCLDYHRKKY